MGRGFRGGSCRWAGLVWTDTYCRDGICEDCLVPGIVSGEVSWAATPKLPKMMAAGTQTYAAPLLEAKRIWGAEGDSPPFHQATSCPLPSPAQPSPCQCSAAMLSWGSWRRPTPVDPPCLCWGRYGEWPRLEIDHTCGTKSSVSPENRHTPGETDEPTGGQRAVTRH